MSGSTMIIENGRIWTPSGFVVDGSVLIEGGRIRAAGPDAAADAPAGTESIDAKGGLVLPGFQDGHIHPFHWAVRELECNLEEAGDEESALAAIAAFAADHPEREWVTGGGWALSTFGGRLPTREMLDAIVPDRPAYLPYTDGHGAWVNSAALERAGIDDDTPDPFKGRIERDERGRATGMLEEHAMDLVADLIPAHRAADVDTAFDKAYRQLLAWGVTGWQDAMIGQSKNWADNLDGYLRAVESGRMRAHVVGALLWDPQRGLEQIPELIERRERSRAARPYFHAGAIKIFQDGVIENFTAGVLAPYLDRCGHTTSNYGQSIIDPDLLNEIVAELARNDFQVHFHALGDRAVREALDAIEYARAKHGDLDLRHTVAHIQVIDAADLARFADLGVIANGQELWARHEVEMDVLTSPFLGERRRRMQYPFGSLLAAGAMLAGGSDWPVTTANPLEIIHTAVTRTAFGAQGADLMPFGGEQAISLGAALDAHTRNVAYLNHDERRSGAITPGFAGDLVVLDRDICELPLSEIAAASVAYTVLGGDVVYEAGRA